MENIINIAYSLPLFKQRCCQVTEDQQKNVDFRFPMKMKLLKKTLVNPDKVLNCPAWPSAKLPIESQEQSHVSSVPSMHYNYSLPYGCNQSHQILDKVY